MSELDASLNDEDDIASWTTEAENGSENQQFHLGAHYLALADSGIDRDNNGKLAVSWLIKSSSQGNKKATSFLKQCLESGTGIAEDNSLLAKWCVVTPVVEKRIHQAATSLFSQLNKDSRCVLSSEDYMSAVKDFSDSIRIQNLLLATGKAIGQKINEGRFVEVLSQIIHGNTDLALNELGNVFSSYKSASTFTKVFVFPRETASLILDYTLEWAASKGMSHIGRLLPTNQINMLVMLSIYSILSPGFLYLVIPLAIFYFSITALVIATLQMFHRRKKGKDCTDLVGILGSFDCHISVDEVQSQYSWNSLTPYCAFFIMLPVVVMSFAVADRSYIPCSELSVLACAMTVLSFVCLSDEYDKLSLLLLSAHCVACSAVFVENLAAVRVLSFLPAMLIEPLAAVEIGMGLVLDISIPSVIHLAIPLILVLSGVRQRWSDGYRILIPHLVCYFWFNITVTAYPMATWIGLSRATLGYLCLPLLVPVSALSVVAITLLLLYGAVASQMLVKVVAVCSLAALPFLLTRPMATLGAMVSGSVPSVIRKAAVVFFVIMVLVTVSYIRLPPLSHSRALDLPWSDYRLVCVPGERDLSPAFQQRCHDFVGARVSWQGRVVSADISRLDNAAVSMFSFLPIVLSKRLWCIYGDQLPECDRSKMDRAAFGHCVIITSAGHRCHVRNLDVYVFQIGVDMGGTTVLLDAGNRFYGVVMALKRNDTLRFSALLLADRIGTSQPRLRLSAVHALNRESWEAAALEAEDDDDGFYYSRMRDALRKVSRFFLFPVFHFTGLSNTL